MCPCEVKCLLASSDVIQISVCLVQTCMKKENEVCLFLVRFESLCDNTFSLLKQYSKISLAVHNKCKRTYPGTYLSIGVEENVRIFNSNRTRHLPCRFTSGMNLREVFIV
jgi:hypothetical protein